MQKMTAVLLAPEKFDRPACSPASVSRKHRLMKDIGGKGAPEFVMSLMTVPITM